MNVLRNRRAVRDYTDARLGRPVLERLIGAAIPAPSAMNLQRGGLPRSSIRNELPNMRAGPENSGTTGIQHVLSCAGAGDGVNRSR